MIHYGAGAVQFAPGHRMSDVSVALLIMLGEEADAAAKDLANEVSTQLDCVRHPGRQELTNR